MNKDKWQIWMSVLDVPMTPEEAKRMKSKHSGGNRSGHKRGAKIIVRATTDNPQALIDETQDIHRGPVIVCDVRDREGVRFGYEINEIGEHVPIGGVTPFPINEKEYLKYYDSTSEYNTAFGWAGWDERLT